MVVACRNDYSRDILTTKGLLPNSRGSTALIYRPYHLCGVETAMSVLTAELLGVGTGATGALVADVLEGEVVTADQVARPADSTLWSLRAQQDEEFLSGSSY